MRDRDAVRAASNVAEVWATIADLLPAARAKLHQFRADGYPPGTGESSVGSNRRSDPVAATVAQAEVTDPPEPGYRERRHRGWRSVDPFGERLKRLDGELARAFKDANRLARELQELTTLHEGPGEDGCFLCDTARLPTDPVTGKAEHRCDDACAERAHRPLNSHQPVHARTAPKVQIDDPAELERVGDLTDVARCSFHYNFAARHGVDAHLQITLWHLDHLGDRVPQPMLRQHHPQELAHHQAYAAGLKGANGRATSAQQRALGSPK